MRFFPTLFVWLLAIAPMQAQLPDGAVAPDFTATDLNGQSRHLYDLLDSGKVVVLEVFATWCAPCWAYHNSHAVQDFFAEHGPAGDDAARVLLVEGDPGTNLNCLYGNQGCNSFSPGNWVAGTDFPILNNDAIGALYAVQYYPTLYVICPNRKAYEIGQLSDEGIWQAASRCPVASGTNNAGIFDYYKGTELSELCGAHTVEPAFTLINLGTAPLSSALLELRWNDSVADTIQWSGYLPLYGEAPIAFAPVEISAPGQLKTSVLQVNGGADDQMSDNTRVDHFTAATQLNSRQALLKIRTDQYGAELYWELRDEDGGVLDRGGNLAVGPNGGGQFPAGAPNGAGAYGNNVVVRDTLQLPTGGCYSLHFSDAYGDGLCCNYGFGYYRLYNMDNPALPLLTGGEFGAQDHRGFGAPTAVQADDPPLPADRISLYPNPAREIVHLAIKHPTRRAESVLIYNSYGQLQYIGALEESADGWQAAIPVHDWPGGLYIVRSGDAAQKILIHKE